MNHAQYLKHVKSFTQEMVEITFKKNPDYSMNDDAMNNFKAISTMLGGGVITPRVVWAVLAGKHITAIMTHMAQGKSLKDETIRGRFIDLANYAMLGDALDSDLSFLEQSCDHDGSNLAEGPVHGNSQDVRNTSTNDGTNRESNIRHDDGSHSSCVPTGTFDVRDTQLYRDH